MARSQRREESAFPNTAALDETRQYTYDNLGRLYTSTVGTDTAIYSYDSAGNRTGEITSDYEKEYIYNSLNQIEGEYNCDLNTYEEQERIFAYDSKGNMLSMYDPETEEVYEYTWTADDLLKSVYYEDGNPEGINVTLASMKYDYEGKRTEKTGTKYVYANGKAVTASSVNHTASYVYAGDETVGAYHGSTWYDYFTDQQGSTVGILKQDGTTAAAYTYSDFGETKARYGESFKNEVCYTGSIYDWETGEYYLNARYYDPALANFLSQDTYRGDTGAYEQWNQYAYCFNEPIKYRDLQGTARLSIAYNGTKRHSLLKQATYSNYYKEGESKIVTVVYGEDFVKKWNNIEKKYKTVYLYVHGDKSELTFRDYADLSLDDLRGLKKKSFIKELYLLSCKGGAGKKKSVAYTLYEKINKKAKVYASKHSVAFRSVVTPLRTYYTPRYNEEYIKEHGPQYYYKNPVKRMKW